jgi:hypothetical protein
MSLTSEHPLQVIIQTTQSMGIVLPLSGKPWPEGELDINGRSW